ncbi:hypothetical protein ACW9H6_22975 [Pseudomonas sp. SDO528_S397]
MNPLTVLRDSFYFFQRNLGAIVQLCLPLLILQALGAQLLDRTLGADAFAGYDIMLGVLIYPLYTGALILFLDARTRGEAPHTRDVLAMAVGLWPRFVLLTAVSSLLILLGMSLYMLLGLLLMVILAFAEYLLVLRGLSALSAMKESIRLSRGHFWRILACLLAVMVPLWLLQGVSMAVYPEPSLGVGVLLDTAQSFLQLFTSVVVFRLFMLIGADADAR